ncbi:MAG: FAD-dependent 5-carboxymethylaminomethyl-2-thiouridine(34) oxidoreductase MnmC [Thiotrichaceae bacterium]|nr:FAD-dependent 5-carboxymethylaminomethyl-2-thiouridine(34) oxidoreductase MnmC [Thiotrichaceae bacterium]
MTKISFKNKPWFQYPKYQWKQRTVTVIGAGIAGCQIANHLQKYGWTVCLIDQNNEVAKNASGNPAGIIAPKITAVASASEDFYCQAFHYVLQQIKQRPNHKEYWHPSGVVQLQTLERDNQRFIKIAERDLDPKIVHLLDPTTASQIANIIIDTPCLHYPQAGWVEPKKFCNDLIQDSQLITNCQASSLNYQNDEWTVFDEMQQPINQSEIVILCTGDQQTLSTQYQPPITPISGQTTIITIDTDKTPQPNKVIDHQGYIIPQRDKNKQLIGASYHRDQQRSQCLAEDNKSNLALQQQHVPSFATGITSHQSAHCATRASTPDRLPYIGAMPIIQQYQQDYADIHQGRHWQPYPSASYEQGLFMMTGFGSRGLTTSAYCAKLLVNLLENQCNDQSINLLKQLHPARYIIRNLLSKIP